MPIDNSSPNRVEARGYQDIWGGGVFYKTKPTKTNLLENVHQRIKHILLILGCFEGDTPYTPYTPMRYYPIYPISYLIFVIYFTLTHFEA